MLKNKDMVKKSKKNMVVTEEEHARWHEKHGGCGNPVEHDQCMKKWGITIKKEDKKKD